MKLYFYEVRDNFLNSVTYLTTTIAHISAHFNAGKGPTPKSQIYSISCSRNIEVDPNDLERLAESYNNDGTVQLILPELERSRQTREGMNTPNASGEEAMASVFDFKG